jgi:glycosyltransferase involved in cell wall biosynthesis
VAEQAHSGHIAVLIVLNELQPSGAETMLRAAGAEWAAKGISVRILALSPRPGPFAEELQWAGYEVTHLWAGSPAKLVLRFRTELQRSPVDVVHLHAERGNFWLAMAARSAGCALVRTIHNVFEFSGALRVERTGQRAVLRLLGTRMVAVSASVRDNEKYRFANPVTVIENWFDPARFTHRTQQDRSEARAHLLGSRTDEVPFVIVTIGNCSAVKNHTLLADALAKVGDAIPWVWLHLGQEDAERSERHLVQRLGISARVRFLGHNETSSSVLAAADVYVMPSRYEGMSIAALEAMARGVPVIFTDVPGLRDLGAESDAVTMVPEDPAAIASAIQALAAQTGLAREKIGSALAEAVRSSHSMSRGVAAYTEIYRRSSRRRVPSRQRRGGA